jgi:hypothetical protein
MQNTSDHQFHECVECMVVPETCFKFSCDHHHCLYCIAKMIKETPRSLDLLTHENKIECSLCASTSVMNDSIKRVFKNATNYNFPSYHEQQELFISQMPILNYYQVIEKSRTSTNEEEIYQDLRHQMRNEVVFVKNMDRLVQQGKQEAKSVRKSHIEKSVSKRIVIEHDDTDSIQIRLPYSKLNFSYKSGPYKHATNFDLSKSPPHRASFSRNDYSAKREQPRSPAPKMDTKVYIRD